MRSDVPPQAHVPVVLSTGAPTRDVGCRCPSHTAGVQRLEIIVGGTSDASGRRGTRLNAAADAGRLVRLAPGRFVDADAWRRATPALRHLARIDALDSRIASRLVIASASAAAVHGLPWRGEFPDTVEVVDPERSTAQSLRLLRKRAGRGRSITTVGMTVTGRRVTDLVTTAVDLAIHHELRLSVPALDVVLRRGVGRSQLTAELERRRAVHGRARASVAIEFADARSDSPGESVGRVALDELGAPRPALQEEFHDAQGFVGRVDFWFAERGVILEYDGRVKYEDPAMRSAGMSASDVVVAEKRREDRLRRIGRVHGVGRFGWREANDADALREVLRAHGVPMTPRTFRSVR